MKKSVHKEVIDLLKSPELDYEATVVELAKEYPTIFLKCAVTPEKVKAMSREEEEKQLVVPLIASQKFIQAIKVLRDYRREHNLEAELQTLLRCKNDCDKYREDLASGVVKIVNVVSKS